MSEYITFKQKFKKCGNSWHIAIPSLKKKELNLAEDDLVEVKIKKISNPLKEVFGTYKFKKSTKEIMREIDEGWKDD